MNWKRLKGLQKNNFLTSQKNLFTRYQQERSTWTSLLYQYRLGQVKRLIARSSKVAHYHHKHYHYSNFIKNHTRKVVLYKPQIIRHNSRIFSQISSPFVIHFQSKVVHQYPGHSKRPHINHSFFSANSYNVQKTRLLFQRFNQILTADKGLKEKLPVIQSQFKEVLNFIRIENVNKNFLSNKSPRSGFYFKLNKRYTSVANSYPKDARQIIINPEKNNFRHSRIQMEGQKISKFSEHIKYTKFLSSSFQNKNVAQTLSMPKESSLKNIFHSEEKLTRSVSKSHSREYHLSKKFGIKKYIEASPSAKLGMEFLQNNRNQKVAQTPHSQIEKNLYTRTIEKIEKTLEQKIDHVIRRQFSESSRTSREFRQNLYREINMGAAIERERMGVV